MSEVPHNDKVVPSKSIEEQILESGNVLYLFGKLPARHGGSYRHRRLGRSDSPLPKPKLRGEVVIRFVISGEFEAATVQECEALGLPLGDTIYNDLQVEPNGQFYRLYAKGEFAERILAVPAGQQLVVAAACTSGWTDEERSTDASGSFLVKVQVSGLVLEKLLEPNVDLGTAVDPPGA